MFNWSKKKVVHWLAIFAIAFGSLAPLMSQANVNSNKTITTEVCTVMGIKMVELDAGGKEPSNFKNQHCPYCLTNAVYILSLPATLDFSQSQISIFLPIPIYQSPKHIFSWLKKPSRAPPKISQA